MRIASYVVQITSLLILLDVIFGFGFQNKILEPLPLVSASTALFFMLFQQLILLKDQKHKNTMLTIISILIPLIVLLKSYLPLNAHFPSWYTVCSMFSVTLLFIYLNQTKYFDSLAFSILSILSFSVPLFGITLIFFSPEQLFDTQAHLRGYSPLSILFFIGLNIQIIALNKENEAYLILFDKTLKSNILRVFYVVIYLVPLFFFKWLSDSITNNHDFYFSLFVNAITVISISFILYSAYYQNRLDLNQEITNQRKLISRISHEIRTPLNGIQGAVDILLTTGQNKSEKKDLFNVVKSSSIYLSNLVNDILDLSKINEGAMTLHHFKLGLIPMLEDIINAENLHVNTHVKLSLIIDKDIPEHVFGDEVKIRQVFSNLINNAVKYTDKGEIKVHLCWENKSKKILSFSVEDTGRGISKTDQKRVFNAFYQSHQKLNTIKEGSGLGLAIVKNIVSLMNGQVEFQSKLGKGSTFKVLLPIAPCSVWEKEGAISRHCSQCINRPKQKQSLNYNAEELQSLKVLVVDDDHINLKIITHMLKAIGVTHIDEAISGNTALNSVKTNLNYDIVLTDLHMPDGNGIELIKGLKSLGFLGHTFLLTADTMSQSYNKAMAAGADDVLTKPYKLIALKRLLLRAKQGDLNAVIH